MPVLNNGTSVSESLDAARYTNKLKSESRPGTGSGASQRSVDQLCRMNRVANTPPSVLLVEDNPISFAIAQRVLEKSGFSVMMARTASAGMSVALETVPDLILLDAALPDGHGFSLYEAMKLQPSLAQTPIIFVTGFDDVHGRVLGLSICPFDFIQKPFAAKEIVARAHIDIKNTGQSAQNADAQSDRLRALGKAQSLFNTDPATFPDSRCAVCFEPSEEAGGDQYDIVELAKGIFGFLIADIAGHGIETIFLASALKILFRENASIADTPSETLHMIDRSLRQHMAEGQHLTAFYLVLNRVSGTGSFACAGHFPCLAVSRSGEVTHLASDGDIMGAFARPKYHTGSFLIDEGTRYWLYTDGALEDFDKGQGWKAGLSKFESAAKTHRGLSLHEALAAVRAALMPPGPGPDDRIIIAVDA